MLFVALPLLAGAQIGINTDYPRALLHIDGGRDNPQDFTTPLTAAQMANDVVVLSNGNVGIGVVNPTVALEIKGKVTVRDGTSLNGQVLQSDANGVSGWQSVELNRVGIIQITGTGSFNETSQTLINGTMTQLKNDIAGLTHQNNVNVGTGNAATITVPPGRYIIYPYFDVTGKEYGIFRLYKDITGSSTNELIWSMEYGLSLSGCSLMIEDMLGSNTYYYTFQALNPKSLLYDTPPYNSKSFKAQMIIHRIP